MQCFGYLHMSLKFWILLVSPTLVCFSFKVITVKKFLDDL
jgi:hypothetical protein